MTDVWGERAEAYRAAVEQASGDDLDLIVRWSTAEGETALDVATGGGHVTRRLREAGMQVTSLDPAPGMQPDVIAGAEHIPFADESFDVVVTRIAPHHFEDVPAAIAEMARVARRIVIVEDTLYTDESVEEAEKLRDPTHIRSYTEAEWLSFLEGAGLKVEAPSRPSRSAIRSRRGSHGQAARARRPTGCASCSRTGSSTVTTSTRRSCSEVESSGDHRRPGHAARGPGHHRPRGLVPHGAQQGVRHQRGRGRDAGEGRPGRRRRARVRHGRRRGRRDRGEHDDGVRARSIRGRRDLRGGRTPASKR